MCEGKMGLCEEKVKSEESPEKSAATSYSRSSEYAALFEPATQITAPHPNPLPRERGWSMPIPSHSYSPAPPKPTHNQRSIFAPFSPLREKGWGWGGGNNKPHTATHRVMARQARNSGYQRPLGDLLSAIVWIRFTIRTHGTNCEDNHAS